MEFPGNILGFTDAYVLY